MDSLHTCKIIELYKKLGVDIYGRCKITPSDQQYAAIDAYIENLELPLISNRSFCGSISSPAFCMKPDDALKLSIIAIIGTYTKINNLVFFMPQNENLSALLEAISEIRSDVYPGSVVGVSVNTDSKCFKVTSYDTGTSRDLSESDMITVVTQLADVDRSMTFYLNPDSLVYATYMHNNISSMWVARLSKSIQTVGSHGSEIMPMLYATPYTDNVLRLNIGRGQIETQKLNLIQSQVYAVNSNIMSALSKDRLCYCCAYMKKVHSILCSHKLDSNISFEAPLLTNFVEEGE